MEHAQKSVDGFDEEIENLREELKLLEIRNNNNIDSSKLNT